jgi:transposase
MERMMKGQEVILKAMAGSLKWWEAAEIIGVSDRTMRRWRERYQEGGYDGLYDRRKRCPSLKRVPLKTAEKCCSSTGRSTSISMCAIFTRS